MCAAPGSSSRETQNLPGICEGVFPAAQTPIPPRHPFGRWGGPPSDRPPPHRRSQRPRATQPRRYHPSHVNETAAASTLSARWQAIRAAETKRRSEKGLWGNPPATARGGLDQIPFGIDRTLRSKCGRTALARRLRCQHSNRGLHLLACPQTYFLSPGIQRTLYRAPCPSRPIAAPRWSAGVGGRYGSGD